MAVPDNRARTYTYQVNLDNSFQLVGVIIPSAWIYPWGPHACTGDVDIGHEFGHALGISGHPEWGGIMDYKGDAKLPNDREVRLITELYRLPHGVHVEADGTWEVR
jgi:hypothetical protein